MKKQDSWKSVLAYAAGGAGLLLSLLLAFFFPSWYGSWRDAQLLGKVTLESRENIEFLDGDSLDIAGRMEKLGSASMLAWSYSYDYDTYYRNYDYDITEGITLSQRKNIQRCKNAVDQWENAGLLPEGCSEWIDTQYHLLLYLEPVLYINDSALPLCFFAFANENIEDTAAQTQSMSEEEETEAADEPNIDLMLVLMDAEKDLIYYASVTGCTAQSSMIQELGYGSREELQNALERGNRIRKMPDISAYDFAGVCSAESASITAEAGQLELLVSLQYDNFEAYAGRSLLCNEGGYGEAVFFGTPKWPSLVNELLTMEGSEEQLLTTDIWCDLLLNRIDYEEARIILNDMTISGGVNAAVFEQEEKLEPEAEIYDEQIVN